MTAITPLRITILARVDGSEVLNEIGTVEVESQLRALGQSDTHAAADAVAVVDIDVPKMLRDVADEIEAQR